MRVHLWLQIKSKTIPIDISNFLGTIHTKWIMRIGSLYSNTISIFF